MDPISGPRRPLSTRPLPTRQAAAGPIPHGVRRPDPTSHRLALGFGGLAAASALATAFLAPVSAAAPAVATTLVTADAGLVQRDVRFVQLLPGQTPPPNASVAQGPVPTPRVVVVTTRQSGTKR